MTITVQCSVEEGGELIFSGLIGRMHAARLRLHAAARSRERAAVGDEGPEHREGARPPGAGRALRLSRWVPEPRPGRPGGRDARQRGAIILRGGTGGGKPQRPRGGGGGEER